MKKGLKKVLSTLLTVTMMASSVIASGMGTVAVSAAVSSWSSSSVGSNGWYETAYTEWLPITGASSYEAYVKKTTDSSYTQLDEELIREYDTFVRADALGLAAGTYNMKIVALNSSGSEIDSYETGSITVEAYKRYGFAFSDGGSSSGAYEDDGTLKSDAVVIYVTDSNKDTIEMDITTSSKGATTTCTGVGPIIKALEKGYETRPLDFRFIGQVSCPTSEQSLNQIDIKRAENPITVEGVGNDAFALFGFNIVEGNNIEVRNLGFKDMTTSDEDGVTIKDESQRIWVHNCDFFYGGQGSDSDQAKGDGSVDLKGTSTNITVSDNHYWDSGKVNLCGLGETADYNITYSRNWFDHSDSRHPRVRTGSIHVYNNYYDGVAKYGVGACTGSSIFVEGNYFRNTAKPVMSSMQGTDASGSGTFSSEDGGIIKMYDNIMTGTYKFIEANNGDGTYNQDSDGYTVASRSDTVPSGLTTVQGGTSYNNFDTTIDLGVDASEVLAASEVPAYVTSNAGRIDGGNFRYDFDNSTEDSNYDVITALKSALAAYTYGTTTSYVSSMSATGIDGNTFYTSRDAQYTSNVTGLPTSTEESGNSSSGSGGSSSGSADLVLNGKTDIDEGTYSTNVTGVGTDGAFSVYAASGKTVTVSSSKGIQLGGSGSTTYRCIVVDTADAGTIYVTSASSGTDTRTLNIVNSSGTIIGTIATGSSDGVELPSAGTYYVYSAGSGINVSLVSVYYSSGSESSTETTTASTDTTTEATTASQTTTSTDTTTEATTASQTTTTSADTTTEATTAASSDDNDGYAMAGTYVINSSATGGDYNISTKSTTAGNVIFSLRDMATTGGRIRNMEDGGYISFELNNSANITITVGSGREDVQIRAYGSTTIAATYTAGASETYTIPAGSYVMESVSDSNAEVASFVIEYISSGDNPSTVTMGDANGDGNVTIADVKEILSYVVGSIASVTNEDAADVNSDSEISSRDAYLIQYYIKNGTWK